MKNPVSPGVFIGIIAACVVIAAAIIVWVYRAPSAGSAAGMDPNATQTLSAPAKHERAQQIMADMKAAHGSSADKEA